MPSTLSGKKPYTEPNPMSDATPYDVSDADGIKKIRLLPPGEGNPRNSEGDFILLADGRLLFVYTHFTGGGADHATAYLAGRYSSDGGETWDAEDSLVLPNEGDQNIMSVSMLRLNSGDIALFYMRKNSPTDCRPYLRKSSDDALTWGEPTLCIPDEGYFVVNNDRVAQLSSGRLVVPTALHNYSDYDLRPGVAMCYISDDDGHTWRRSESTLHAPEGSHSGLQEPGIVELKDGRLMMLCRTDQGCQMRSWSEDGGVTWSPIETTDILSPVSPATFKRIPSTGDLLMAWNDHTHISDELRGKRTPFTVAISRDDGLTWEHTKTIDDDPEGWYCYTAMTFIGERVLLGHCAGNIRTGGLNLTQITVFDVDWLYQ